MLKNPSIAYVGLRYNLSLIEYPISTDYGIVFNHYEVINDYYTEPDTSTMFSTTILNLVQSVQIDNNVDLSIDLGS